MRVFTFWACLLMALTLVGPIGASGLELDTLVDAGKQERGSGFDPVLSGTQTYQYWDSDNTASFTARACNNGDSYIGPGENWGVALFFALSPGGNSGYLMKIEPLGSSAPRTCFTKSTARSGARRNPPDGTYYPSIILQGVPFGATFEDGWVILDRVNFSSLTIGSATPTPVVTTTRTPNPVPSSTRTPTPVPTTPRTPTPVPTATRTPTPTGAPSNDNFPGQTLGGLAGVVNGTNVGATRQRDEPGHGAGQTGSLWYTWTAPAFGSQVFFQTSALVETDSTTAFFRFAVYTGTAVNALTSVTPIESGISDGTGEYAFYSLSPGTTYRIAVVETGQQTGPFRLEWSVDNANITPIPTATATPTPSATRTSTPAPTAIGTQVPPAVDYFLYDSDTEGFGPWSSGTGGLGDPSFLRTEESVGFTSSQFPSFGFWESPYITIPEGVSFIEFDAFVAYEGEDVECPTFRLRVNDDAFQYSQMIAVESSGDGLHSPASYWMGHYSMRIYFPYAVGRVRISFDYLNFDSTNNRQLPLEIVGAYVWLSEDCEPSRSEDSPMRQQLRLRHGFDAKPTNAGTNE